MSSPSTARNKEPILIVLRRILPAKGKVLEVASGAGEHAVFFAAAMPGLDWWPSDPDAAARDSVAARVSESGIHNVREPVPIDVRDQNWGAPDDFDAVVAINMIHIAPWAATLGLMAGASRRLRVGGVLVTYGPYKRDGKHTAQSNDAFDVSLRARNAEWGVRDVSDVERAARAHELFLRETIEMPANNLTLVFERRR